MTRPSQPPPSSIDQRQLARDVAKQIDRRRIRRRLWLWTILLAVVAAAAAYLRCGGLGGLGGLGLGGSGPASEEAAPQPLTARQHCTIRLSASGITVDGVALSRDAAVADCAKVGRAEAIVTGDVRSGDWKELEAALRAAGVTDIALRDRRDAPGSAAR